jgi:hypothetical protein
MRTGALPHFSDHLKVLGLPHSLDWDEKVIRMSVKDDRGRSYEVTVANAELADDLRFDCEIPIPQDISPGQFCFLTTSLLIANRLHEGVSKVGLDLNDKVISFAGAAQAFSGSKAYPDLAYKRLTEFLEFVTLSLDIIGTTLSIEVSNKMVNTLWRRATH